MQRSKPSVATSTSRGRKCKQGQTLVTFPPLFLSFSDPLSSAFQPLLATHTDFHCIIYGISLCSPHPGGRDGRPDTARRLPRVYRASAARSCRPPVHLKLQRWNGKARRCSRGRCPGECVVLVSKSTSAQIARYFRPYRPPRPLFKCSLIFKITST